MRTAAMAIRPNFAGEEKARMGWLRLVTLSFITGCYIGLGLPITLLVRIDAFMHII
jgi:hypothetical protein